MAQSMRLRESDLLAIREQAWLDWLILLVTNFEHGPWSDGGLQYECFGSWVARDDRSRLHRSIRRAIGEARWSVMTRDQVEEAALWATTHARESFRRARRFGLLSEAQEAFVADVLAFRERYHQQAAKAEAELAQSYAEADRIDAKFEASLTGPAPTSAEMAKLLRGCF